MEYMKENSFSPLISSFIYYCEDHFHIHITAFFYFLFDLLIYLFDSSGTSS